MILASTLITGVKYPKVAASLCGVWTVCRVLYTIGYSTGNPKKVGDGTSRRAESIRMLTYDGDL